MELLDKLKEYGVDVDTAVARFVGKKDLYIKFLTKFLQDTSFDGLRDSVQQKQCPQAFEYAHSMKGVCGNLNLSPLTEQVSGMTEILRNKETLAEDEWQQVGGLMAEAEKSYKEITQILKDGLEG